MTERLPYGRQTLGREEFAAVKAVLESGWLTQGPRVPEMERTLAAACGARHALAVTNGTAALHLACLAAGLGPGDRFLTSPLTFTATASAALHCGAEPVFADIDPVSFNIDPELVGRALKADPTIKVMLPVHFGGLPCDLDSLAEIAADHGVTVIEDACHALGGSWQDREGRWRKIGACDRSAMTCFSFHPVKTVTTCEGGAITTGDPKLADRIELLRSHGITRDPARLRDNHGPWYYEMQSLGWNARMSDLHAAIGSVQMTNLEQWRRRRLELVNRYDAAFSPCEGLTTQIRPTGDDRSCWHLMVVRCAGRNALFAHLKAAGIDPQVHYIPLHLHPYFRDRFGTGPGRFPEAERYYAEALSLPLYPDLSDAECDRVIDAVLDFTRTGAHLRSPDQDHA